MLSSLAISTDSWHYKYYTLIRKVYGSEPKQISSLCPYFQTCFWGTIFLIAMSPIWSVGLVGSWFCTVFLSVFDRPLKWLDKDKNVRNFGTSLESYFSKTPTAYNLEYQKKTVWDDIKQSFLFTCSLLGLVFYSLFTIIAVCVYGLVFIKIIVYQLYIAVTYVAYAIFQILGLVGFLTNVFNTHVIQPCYKYMIYGLDFIANNWNNSEVWQIIGIYTLVGVGLMSLGYLAYRYLFYSLVFNPIKNGVIYIHDSRIRAIENKPRYWNCPNCETENSTYYAKKCISCEMFNPNRLLPFSRLWRFLKNTVFGKQTKVGNVIVSVLGPIAIAKNMFWAIKNRACPRIEFVSNEELQDRAKKSIQQMNTAKILKIPVEHAVKTIEQPIVTNAVVYKGAWWQFWKLHWSNYAVMAALSAIGLSIAKHFNWL